MSTKRFQAGRRLLLLGLVSCVILAGRTPLHAGGKGGDPGEAGRAKSPRRVVASFHEALIAAMKAGREAGFEKRYELLAPAVRSSFDVKLVAQLVLGSHWASLTDPQRARFKETLLRFTAAKYASRFEQHKGESFEIRSVREQRPGLRVVRAIFTAGSGKQRTFDYQVRRSEEGRWRIVNVAVDGVSDLAVKRAQYVDLIDREGFDALIERLQKRYRQMREGEGEDG